MPRKQGSSDVTFWSHGQRCHHGPHCHACCWRWTGSHDQAGYARGKVQFMQASGAPRREVIMHRGAYSLAHGRNREVIIPAGFEVCHTCDVRDCCNPQHLWLGTHAQNIADREAKGRGWRGERASRPQKLTPALVQQIRQAWGRGRTQRSIADEVGVSQVLISLILQRKVWAWVPERPPAS